MTAFSSDWITSMATQSPTAGSSDRSVEMCRKWPVISATISPPSPTTRYASLCSSMTRAGTRPSCDFAFQRFLKKEFHPSVCRYTLDLRKNQLVVWECLEGRRDSANGEQTKDRTN